MISSKLPMPSDLVAVYQLAANMYDYDTSDISSLISCMQSNSMRHTELSKIFTEWLATAIDYKINPDLYAGITITSYLQFKLKADSLNINIDWPKLEYKQTSASHQTETEVKATVELKKGTREEKKAVDTTPSMKHKTPASLAVGNPLSLLDRDSLNNLEHNFFNQLSDDRMLLANTRTYKLKQNAKGLLVIERESYFPIQEITVSTLTESLNKLAFLKSITNCFTSEKNEKGINNIFTITFSEEATQAIITSCKLTKEPLSLEKYLGVRM